MSDTYDTIDLPYDNLLNRTPLDGDNGNVNSVPVKTGGQMSDITVDTYIKSTNYAPKTTGFYIDGLSGHAEFCDVFVSGNIQALTGTIGGFTIGATSLSVSAGGNTVTISSGATAFLAGPTGSPAVTISQAGVLNVSNISITGGSININNNAIIGSTGYATFIGVSSLNKKAYTNFESIGRFSVNTIGSGSVSFGATGALIFTGGTPTSLGAIDWIVSNVFTNNPTFTFTVNCFAMFAASGSSRTFFGLGKPTSSGNGITYTGISHIGFKIEKDSGVVTVSSEMGDASGNVGSSLTTVVDTDKLELLFKVTDSLLSSRNVKFYYRKNGGSLVLGDTQTTHIPTSTGENTIRFIIDNIGTAFNFELILEGAAYEH